MIFHNFARPKNIRIVIQGLEKVDAVWRFASVLFRFNPELVEIYKNLHNKEIALSFDSLFINKAKVVRDSLSHDIRRLAHKQKAKQELTK